MTLIKSFTMPFHIFGLLNRKVLGLIIRCKIGGNNFPLLVDHVSREAVYFRSRFEQLNTGNLDPLPDAVINENVFFLRIMADHAKFINHLLDPSERKLVDQNRVSVRQLRDFKKTARVSLTHVKLRKFTRKISTL